MHRLFTLSLNKGNSIRSPKIPSHSATNPLTPSAIRPPLLLPLSPHLPRPCPRRLLLRPEPERFFGRLGETRLKGCHGDCAVEEGPAAMRPIGQEENQQTRSTFECGYSRTGMAGVRTNRSLPPKNPLQGRSTVSTQAKRRTSTCLPFLNPRLPILMPTVPDRQRRVKPPVLPA